MEICRFEWRMEAKRNIERDRESKSKKVRD